MNHSRVWREGACTCSVGTDTERPELQGERREDPAGSDLEGLGNHSKRFSLSRGTACVLGIRRHRWEQPGGLLGRLGTACGGEAARLGNTLQL